RFQAGSVEMTQRPTNLGTGRNINSPKPRLLSTRLDHRSFQGSAAETIARCLAAWFRRFDFRKGPLVTGGSVAESAAIRSGATPLATCLALFSANAAAT